MSSGDCYTNRFLGSLKGSFVTSGRHHSGRCGDGDGDDGDCGNDHDDMVICDGFAVAQPPKILPVVATQAYFFVTATIYTVVGKK